jgi:hypothetical protein
MLPASASVEVPFQLYIIGLGITGVRDLTREAESSLRGSSKVFYVDQGFGVGDYLRSLSPSVHDLLAGYQQGASGLVLDRTVIARVLDAALDDPPVTFAVHGHPTFFDYSSILMQKAAALLDLSVRVIPGISSLDTLLIDLALDPASTGLQIFAASAMLRDQRRLDPEVPCLLFQVDAVAETIESSAGSKAEGFKRLEDHLHRFYPADHPIMIVQSPTFPIFAPILERFPLRELRLQLEQEPVSGTLFIPARP